MMVGLGFRRFALPIQHCGKFPYFIRRKLFAKLRRNRFQVQPLVQRNLAFAVLPLFLLGLQRCAVTLGW